MEELARAAAPQRWVEGRNGHDLGTAFAHFGEDCELSSSGVAYLTGPYRGHWGPAAEVFQLAASGKIVRGRAQYTE